MSAADFVLTCKRLGRVERAFRTMKASDLQARAHLLICMLGYYVEMRMRDALAPMLFDDEDGPVRDSPVAKAERSPQAKRKAASKRTSSGGDVHDFRGLLAQLGTLAMNRIEPSGPGKPGFDVLASPTPIQAQTLRLLNAKPRYRRSPCGSPLPVHLVQSPDGRNPKKSRTFKQLFKRLLRNFRLAEKMSKSGSQQT